MRLIYSFIAMVAFFSACTFDTGGLNAVNTNNTNLCENKDCSNNGTCVVEEGEAICHCENNFTGDSCTECATGFVGESCSDCATDFVALDDESCIKDPCIEETCSANGDCTVDSSTGDASCLCDNAYQGPDCSFCATDYILLDENCVLNPCLGVDCGGDDKGECVYDSQAVASCNCVIGYTLGEITGICDTCDGTENYILHEEECKLDLCVGMDCGLGKCILNETSWTASCDCQDLALGLACEYPFENILVYKYSATELAIQVKDDTRLVYVPSTDSTVVGWGNFNSSIQMLYWGETSGGQTTYFQQTDIQAGGFLIVQPCAAGFDEYLWLRLSDTPHTETEMLVFENLAWLAWFDPQGFIWTDPVEPNKPKFRVQCQGGQIIAAAGN